MTQPVTTERVAHTPGPWVLRSHSLYNTVVEAGYKAVADVYGDDDARLVSAAPDLLAVVIALKDEIAAVGVFVKTANGWRPTNESQALLLEAAEAAIAKAEGREP